ncbi:(2Fe-2S) ferredoxin domain-containing protein [Alkalicella caledoniensis]|uniref:(2Fe-2S) ferredoxin domain-containing protein n=1 Tax=Alkalicella caledoniensis TaxID=2731377 RepID=A0A7G9W5G8_ALKCA|nr:(2Fe-2S) ferredoxin domain-containing protein [Alkalicella caledoniensis]QNO13930.1 (2Fe-2S) ferredoxin domain-containing protein [Alkalicella caledoniensis]
MKSLKELRELKEKALVNLKVRNASDEKTVKVHVGMGTCGISAGAREILMAMIDEINDKHIENIRLTQVGCMGNCFEEPIVRVIHQGAEPIVYTKVDPAKAKEIVNSLQN